MKKSSLLILYTGEYRTFEHCIKTHDFLRMRDYDITVLCNFWDKTATQNLHIDSGVFFSRRDVITQRIVTKEEIEELFDKHNITHPLHIVLHNSMLVSKQFIKIPPLLLSWKVGLDTAKKLNINFDHVMMLRPDIFFPDCTTYEYVPYTLCSRQVKSFDSRKIIGVFGGKSIHYGVNDFGLFGSFNTIINYVNCLLDNVNACVCDWHGYMNNIAVKNDYKYVNMPVINPDSMPQISRFESTDSDTYQIVQERYIAWWKDESKLRETFDYRWSQKLRYDKT